MTDELEAVLMRIDDDIAECVRVCSLEEHELSDVEFRAAARRIRHITDGVSNLSAEDRKIAMKRVREGMARVGAARDLQQKRFEETWASRSRLAIDEPFDEREP